MPASLRRPLEAALTFKKSALVLIGIQLTAYLCVVLQNRIIVDLISVEFIGQLAVIFGYASLLSAVLNLGWPQLILRDVAKKRDSANLHKDALSQGLVVTLAALGAVALASCGATWIPGVELPDFAWLAFIISATTICGSLFGAVMQGKGHVLVSRCLSGILRPLIIILSVVFMSVEGITMHMTGYFVAHGLHLAILVGFALWFGARVHLRHGLVASVRWRTSLSSENIFVLIITGFNALILATDVLVLQLFESLDVVGNYSIIVSLLILVSIGMGAVNSLFLPSYGHAIGKGDWLAAREMFATSQRISSVWSIAAVCVLAMATTFAAPVFGISPGLLFAPAIVVILGLSQVVNAATGPNTNSLFVEGKTQFIAVSLGAAALLNVAGNFILVPWFGALGAALSTGIFVSLVHWIQFTYAKRTSRIHNDL